MADIRTQDNQKVFKSATTNLQSFVDGVQNVSSTKNMEIVYNNMGKMFDAFTNGVLTQQGANSELLLRQVYRSLSDDFLKIIQNSKATDKIVELIKNKQDEVRSSDEAKNSPNITQTTKKVVQSELQPVDFDAFQVIADFVNELQTYILQIKRDVARQVDQKNFTKKKVTVRRIEPDKQENNTDSSDIDQQISEQEKWSNELDQLNGESKINLDNFTEDDFNDLFDSVSGLDLSVPTEEGLAKLEQSLDKKIQIAKQLQKQGFNPNKTISKIKNQDEDQEIGSSDTKLVKEELFKETNDQIKTPEKSKQKEQVKEQHQQSEQKSDDKQDNQSGKDDNKDKQDKKEDKEKNDSQQQSDDKKDKQDKKDNKEDNQSKEKPNGDNNKVDEKKKVEQIKRSEPQPPKPKVKQDEKKEQSKDSKLNVKLSPDGMCVCPICGQKHPDGKHPNQEPQQNKKQQNKITSSGVLNAISEIHGSVGNLLNNSKFKSNFMLDYKNINKNVQKQMKRVDKDEDTINKNLKQTQKNIKELKKNKNGGKSIIGMIFNPLVWMNIAFIAIGGVILITLTRTMLKKFKDTYMPPSDGKTVKLFGIPIPGISEIKSLCVGIYNFATVGIPNIYGKIKVWISGVKKSLFGKDGMFSSMAQVKNTLRKIALAWVVGQTKNVLGKLLGPIGQVLKFALKFTKLVPGWGMVISVAVEVLPLLFSFIATQIMLQWSNSKAATEEKMEGIAKNLKSSAIKSKMLNAAQNVSPMAPPSAMPGLQTPKSGSRRQLGGAIMRRVELKTTGRTDFAKLSQKKSLDDEIEKTKDSTKKLYSGNDTKSPIGRMSRNLENVASGGMTDLYIQTIYNTTIKPQVQKLDSYIEFLNKSKRFRNVKGGLYDPINGWNPGYRVYQSDLMSPIPMNPFEGIHDKADVKLGEPSKGDESYIGIMPYTWIQNGVQVSAHPLKYEIARALAIRKIWSNLWEDVQDAKKWNETPWWKKGLANRVSDLQNYLFPKYDKEWRKTSYVTQGDFGNDIVYGDRFVRFLEKFRAGEIDHAQNNMNTVDDMGKTNWNLILNPVGYLAKKSGSWAMGEIQNTTKRISKDASYGKQDEEYQSVKGNGFFGGLKSIWGNAKTFAKNKISQAGSLYWIKKFSDISFDGVSYGDVRDMMLDGGILNMFSSKQILAPIAKASSLIKLLLERKILEPANHKNDEPVLHDLMWEFFVNREKIAGYEWKKMQTDEYAQAGFAQSLLEYFGLKVMPLWNKAEKLLKHTISNNGDGTPELVKTIKTLTGLFGLNSIMEFLSKHLRFKNMKTILIDETNAGEQAMEKIQKFKKELGILSQSEKQNARNKILKILSSYDQKEIEEGLAYIGKIIGPLKIEATATGQMEFVKDILTYQIRLQQKLNDMKNPGQVSKTDTKITNNTVQIPPKSKEELAKEEAKRKKKEEEQKRKEAEEKRKKLEADKKRAEAVAIAKAKIEAMEKIRKQEKNYEEILNKMVADPSKVTDAELKSLGDEVNNLKQEAENRINDLPREQRELKLALIRGDKVSPKSFKELKDSVVGLGGSLQSYVEEVHKIPCGSILAVQNTNMPNSNPVKMADSDSVDMGDD